MNMKAQLISKYMEQTGANREDSEKAVLQYINNFFTPIPMSELLTAETEDELNIVIKGRSLDKRM